MRHHARLPSITVEHSVHRLILSEPSKPNEVLTLPYVIHSSGSPSLCYVMSMTHHISNQGTGP
jgi:hypothetical protein